MSNTELATVQALEDERITALCAQDVDTLERLLSDSMVYVHSSGLLDTKESFLGHVRNGPIQYRTFARRDDVAYAPIPGTVIIRGCAAVGIEFDGTPVDLDFRYLAVWAKHESGWRFEAWQSTSTG